MGLELIGSKAKVFKVMSGPLEGYAVEADLGLTIIPVQFCPGANPMEMGICPVPKMLIKELWTSPTHCAKNVQITGNACWYEEKPAWWSERK